MMKQKSDKSRSSNGQQPQSNSARDRELRTTLIKHQLKNSQTALKVGKDYNKFSQNYTAMEISADTPMTYESHDEEPE
ncbi:UNKNOWN [Stylonychia lemnae]|uniref:Uncharacterized protein n=1 Tax=Stylonychia lemnae TaxID=5949 RepID=A0A078AKB8_STYLE|nr:UNKNOWN [Stylonychia lemnae]|eukprot:CDW82644.1 UNKNOWN [Stylonychia lemnae]